MADLPSELLQRAISLRRLIEQPTTSDVRDTAQRDLAQLCREHPALQPEIERRFRRHPEQF
jgi:hypothetical protein